MQPTAPAEKLPIGGQFKAKALHLKVLALLGLIVVAHLQILPTHAFARLLYALPQRRSCLDKNDEKKPMDRWFDTKRYRYDDDLVWETWICLAVVGATVLIGWAMTFD